ncbi:inner centromere protein A-like [Palaemon carinicauda]|uniref:inner centromere protein A-like n=1 Tax=Palaemon carinicauda TaxID=392227 RepID=UPI0035B5A37B
MKENDHLFELFLQAQEKYKTASESFEEHFLWLEEALAAAKESFSHTHQVLLPKTPAAKKRGRPKKIDHEDSDDDASSSKRSQTGSICQSEYASPEGPPARRGRAASRIAQERMAKSYKEGAKRKLRRPSTPEDIYTIKKTRPTRQVTINKDYDEFEDCTSESLEVYKKDSDDAGNEEPKKESLSNSKIVENHETPKKLSSSIRRSSSIGKKLIYTKSNEDDQGEEVDCKLKLNVNGLDEIETDIKKSVSLTSTQNRDSGIDECQEEIDLKKKSIVEIPDTSQCSDDTTSVLDKKVDNLEVPEVIEIRSESDDLDSRSDPVPKARSTRTKQMTAVSSQSPPVPKPRTTRTKQRTEPQTDTDTSENEVNVVVCLNSQKENVKEVEQSKVDMLPPPELPKARSTRTKRKQDDAVTVNSFEPPTSSLKVTNECSTSDAEYATEANTSTDSFVPPEAPKGRSTRTKKKQAPDSNSEGVEIEEPKSRSTRTKKKMDECVNGDPVMQSENETSDSTSRSTRTKKRQVEQEVNQPSRSTRTKRKKVEEERSGESDKENSTGLSAVQTNNYYCSPGSKAARLIQKYQSTGILSSCDKDRLLSKTTEVKSTNQRLTRSKIRQVPVVKVTPKKDSPFNVRNCKSPATKIEFQRDCCSPRSESGTPKNKQIISRVGSPLRYSPRPNNSDKEGRPGFIGRAPFQKDILQEVEEIPCNRIEVTHSPIRVTRHSGGKATRRESSTRRSARESLKRAKKIALKMINERTETPDTRWARINPQPRTPSPQCPPDKVIRPKMGLVLTGNSTFGSSGRITPKTYSRIKPGLMNSASSSSTEYRKTQKKMFTPTEVNRTKNVGNIVSAVSSFIKVQAPKPTREDLEAKKQLEMQKKREREEEIRKKKEEMLKSKAEEQKRRNEERMRRAKVAREEQERKAEEAKELQQTERRQREERLREEQSKKKQILMARKQAEEEAKARKIKELMEEEKRRLEEKRLADEARKAEEAKKIEEERIAEKLRLQEEEKRKKRVAEVERIARERKEMEQLKLREKERLAAANKAGTSKTASDKHNETYNKDSPESTNANSTFTMATGSNNPHDYGINNIKSDDSTDDEEAPKKVIPTWAQANQLRSALINQEYYPPDINTIFAPEDLLSMPDLVEIFPVARRRFFKRTSSAIWTTPPHKLMDQY